MRHTSFLCAALRRRRPRWLGLALGGWLILGCPVPAAAAVLYLQADGVPDATLSPVMPAAPSLANHDPGRDTAPGLQLEPGGVGPGESNPLRVQRWRTQGEEVRLDGPVAFVFWSALRGFATGARGEVEAYLLDCDAGGACTLIGQGARRADDWSGGYAAWQRHSIEFGALQYVVPADRSLVLEVVAGGGSADAMWLAYGAAPFPSYVTDRAPSDAVVDCDFGDWGNGLGVEFELADQGGPDDWGSPARLDVTRFGVSSNLVDALSLLMAFDDPQPQNGHAALLVDTDFDNLANRALLVDWDGSSVSLSLYGCDDTLPDGCGGALLEKTYPQSAFCAAAAPGPWGQDAHVEMELPLSDLGSPQGVLAVSGLVSYAAQSLLNSPKDAVLGATGQAYDQRIAYDLRTGRAWIVGSLGPAYRVYRAPSPVDVRAGGEVFTATSAPFDDVPGLLDDGQSWFYLVEREGGFPVDLSLVVHPLDRTVRVGFDDQDPRSAPADPLLSNVEVPVPQAPADGTSQVTVRVVPRDAQGVPLGGGLELELDEAGLVPARLVGPVADLGNGTYEIGLVSDAPAAVQVVVTVEGVLLLQAPVVTFVP